LPEPGLPVGLSGGSVLLLPVRDWRGAARYWFGCGFGSAVALGIPEPSAFRHVAASLRVAASADRRGELPGGRKTDSPVVDGEGGAGAIAWQGGGERSDSP